MSKLFFKAGLILLFLLSQIVGSVKAEKNGDQRFLFSFEKYKEGQSHFDGTKYLSITYSVVTRTKWGKQFYTAHLIKANASDSYFWGSQFAHGYYEAGEPVASEKPIYIKILVRFLENHPVRFSFKDGQLEIENGDSLHTAFSEEIEKLYPQKNPPGYNDDFFKLQNLLNVFQHMLINLPKDLQKPNDLSLIKGVVYNYLEDYGRLRHLEITDTKNHTKSNLYVPTDSNRVKYKKVLEISGQTIVRTSNLNEKHTMTVDGILSNQKNKTIEYDIEGASLLDPLQKNQIKTDVDGKFRMILDLDFPVTISSSSGHQFYLEPGDAISVRSNSKGDSLFIAGIGAKNNQYIQKEMNLRKFPEVDYHIKNAQMQSQWFHKADRVTNDRFVLLNNYVNGLSPLFYESKYLSYYFGKINRKLDFMFCWFENSGKGILKRNYPGLDSIPTHYQSFVYNLECNKYQENKLLLLFEKLRDFTHINSYEAKESPSQTEMLRLATLTYSGKILRDYFEFVAPRIYRSNKPDDIKVFQDLVQEYFDNTRFQTKISVLVAKATVLEIGNLFPMVKFKDTNGLEKNISQYRGKVIYLMFWRNDALALDKKWNEYRQLMGAMKNKNVLFVNVGMEVDFTNWKKYVEAMKLEGLNLFVDRNSDDFKKYLPGLNSRHYFLIDNTGKIVNNNGPDPSVASVLITQNMGSSNREEMLLGGLIFFTSILVILGLVWLISRTRQKRKTKIESLLNRLRETELKAIKAQMNPHFLFNSLNSIQNLINRKDIEAANVYLSKFARLLRAVLQHSEKEFIPLSDEIESISLYVQLERLRFNFDFQLEVSEGLDPYNSYIPPLLLQPFIENAILHGLQPKQGAKWLKIRIEEQEKQLFCLISDNGVGRKAALSKATNHHGMGNKLSEERIKLLNQKNNSNFMLRIEDGLPDIGGTRVTVSFTNNLI